MKKLIALFAVSTMASTAAVAGIALSGSASVSYDDNGSTGGDATYTYDADLTIVGTGGGTTLTAAYDMEGASLATTAVDLATTVGPITVAADLFDEDDSSTASGGQTQDGAASDTGVTVSLSAPVGDATIALDDTGDVTISGTWSGVTVSHTIKDGSDKTVGSVSVAGVDISLTNDAGATTWTLGTTVSGVDLELKSDNNVSATFGLAGNTMTVAHVPAVASAAAVATGVAATNGGNGKLAVTAVDDYSTVAIARDLTSGATLTATYSTLDDSLTLKAAVTF